MRPGRPGAARRGDGGAAVVEFVLVSVVLVFLVLGVLQVGVYVHLRNVIAASAAEGARYAANADRAPADGGPQARDVLTRAAGAGTAGRLDFTAGLVDGRGGLALVEVRVRGGLPTVFLPVGALLPIDVTARAIREGQ